MKLLNEAVDQAPRAERKERPEISRTRYLWLNNPVKLRLEHAELLEVLRKKELGLKAAEAYRLKLNFDKVWALLGVVAAGTSTSGARRSRRANSSRWCAGQDARATPRTSAPVVQLACEQRHP